MLSGETAVGDYPIESVSIMNKIINDVERDRSRDFLTEDKLHSDNDARSAIGASVKAISKHLKIDGIVVMTESGSTALMLSRTRSDIPIYAFTRNEITQRRVSLFRGVLPFPYPFLAESLDQSVYIQRIIETIAEISLQNDGSYLADPKISIRELNNKLKVKLPFDNAKTLNGLILEQLQSFPQHNVSLKIDPLIIEIIQVNKQGIKLVKIKKLN